MKEIVNFMLALPNIDKIEKDNIRDFIFDIYDSYRSLNKVYCTDSPDFRVSKNQNSGVVITVIPQVRNKNFLMRSFCQPSCVNKVDSQLQARDPAKDQQLNSEFRIAYADLGKFQQSLKTIIDKGLQQI
ncbi:hypothetical protein [Yunchengibacter salinarum]|uniref:hypothetical protein n=1 Tax=Yunchengibacter salinarum TaxID=3133399 RepID=UPI0035B5D689